MTTTNPTTSETVTARAAARFISDYACRLLECGATCVRIEKNVNRIARTWHLTAAMTITPAHISLTVSDTGSSDTFTLITAVSHTSVSYDMNTSLSRLSWHIADNATDPARATAMLHEITNRPRPDKWKTLPLVALANASFCRLFGGDATAMATVFAATTAGYALKLILSEAGMDLRPTLILCAFVSSVLGATDGLFSLGSTPDIAIATSILYLVPGIPFLNAFSDMIAGHYTCSFSRLAGAAILTCCLSAGLCGGMLLMGAGMF